MNRIDDFEIAVKSPGIPSNTLPADLNHVYLSSQTDIFLQAYGRQVIEITGTKGKSTTSSLVYHILKNAGKNTMLVGNIGIPPFDCVNDIKPETLVVMELSSHQLEYVSHAPHIAVLLNLFQEHLDHYYTYEEYKSAKINIGRYQSAGDYFIYNHDNETLLQMIENQASRITILFRSHSRGLGQDISFYIKYEWIEIKLGSTEIKLYNLIGGQPLKGQHNIYNIMAAAAASYLCRGFAFAD
ncbi:MAG: Mur ligase family protein [Bacteroidales bacterium]